MQKNQVGSRVNLFLLQVKKIGFRSSIFQVESENSDPFCHVYSFASHEFIQRLSRLTGKYKSQSRKRFREIFQNLGSRDFGDSLGDSFVSQLSRKKCVFCKNRVKNHIVFQKFSVSLTSRACLFVFSTSPSDKTIFSTPKTSIFLFNLHSKSKKRYGFSLLFTLFQV